MPAYFLIVALSIVGVFADFLLKLSTRASSKLTSWIFLLAGLVIYSSTAFGWFYVIKHVKLSTLGVWYAVSTVLFLTIGGALFFKEQLTIQEITGVLLAVISLILLTRFS
jgi:small multidrug resistance pump